MRLIKLLALALVALCASSAAVRLVCFLLVCVYARLSIAM